jgi:hypothetical protein
MFYRRGLDTLSYVGRSNKKLESKFLSTRLQIGYLRSLKDSARVQAACVRYLQSELLYFHPERPDLVTQIQELAAEFGVKVEVPRLSWKYRWIQMMFGWSAAKRAQLLYNRCKSSVAMSCEKAILDVTAPLKD